VSVRVKKCRECGRKFKRGPLQTPLAFAVTKYCQPCKRIVKRRQNAAIQREQEPGGPCEVCGQPTKRRERRLCSSKCLGVYLVAKADEREPTAEELAGIEERKAEVRAARMAGKVFAGCWDD